jgi:hypothetical protein
MEDFMESVKFLKALNPRLWRRIKDAVLLVLAAGLALGTGWATNTVNWGLNAFVDYQTEKVTRILDDVTDDLIPTVTSTTVAQN